MLSPASETVALHIRLIRNPIVSYCFKGKARAENLPNEQRAEIVRKATWARWDEKRQQEKRETGGGSSLRCRGAEVSPTSHQQSLLAPA